jgi:hypothetical protein
VRYVYFATGLVHENGACVGILTMGDVIGQVLQSTVPDEKDPRRAISRLSERQAMLRDRRLAAKTSVVTTVVAVPTQASSLWDGKRPNGSVRNVDFARQSPAADQYGEAGANATRVHATTPLLQTSDGLQGKRGEGKGGHASY